MLEIFNYLKKFWNIINSLSSETRTLLIMLLFGYILYFQIGISTQHILEKRAKISQVEEKEAEQYSKDTAIEVNRHIQLIAQKDQDALDVLLLSYHNSKQSLSGYRFLYLSCIAEAPNSIDTPLLGQQWTNLDYIYYIDELEKIHNKEVVTVSNIESMKSSLPKLYRLVKASEAQAASFYVMEGKNSPIGIVVILYKHGNINGLEKATIVMPSIQKMALLLDYENK